jgi:hypothetical protein
MDGQKNINFDPPKVAKNAFLSKHHKNSKDFVAFVRISSANSDEKTCKNG